MRTSVSQFLILVDFMERLVYGDLNKPAEGPYGRLNNVNKWADLVRVLNMDLTGEGKSVEKWKKVWSDLKNNTKRKVAKLHKAAVGTGGGPSTKVFLSDLELRVLNIIGSQAATGLIEVEEVGLMSPTPLPEASPTPPASAAPFSSEPRVAMIHIETSPRVYDSTESSIHPLPYIPHPSTPSILHIYIPHASTPSIPHTYIPHPSTPSILHTSIPHTYIPHASTPSIPHTYIPHASTPSIPHTYIPHPFTLSIPSIPHPSSTTPHSSHSRPTVHRRHVSRRRAPRTSRVDAATRQFQTSDERWRNLISEIASENQQLRRREIKQQAQWQSLFTRFMDIAEDYLKK